MQRGCTSFPQLPHFMSLHLKAFFWQLGFAHNLTIFLPSPHCISGSCFSRAFSLYYTSELPIYFFYSINIIIKSWNVQLSFNINNFSSENIKTNILVNPLINYEWQPIKSQTNRESSSMHPRKHKSILDWGETLRYQFDPLLTSNCSCDRVYVSQWLALHPTHLLHISLLLQFLESELSA